MRPKYEFGGWKVAPGRREQPDEDVAVFDIVDERGRVVARAYSNDPEEAAAVARILATSSTLVSKSERLNREMLETNISVPLSVALAFREWSETIDEARGRKEAE